MNPLRPSNLPKLAVCPRYMSKPGPAGDAARRGTLMDEAFREANSGNMEPLDSLDARLADESLAPGADPVRWALARIYELAGAAAVVTHEDDLRLAIEGTVGGTADAAAPAAAMGFDLKSGGIHNYLEQMAAYALGFMDREFADSWTMHVVFCDQREVITYKFTHAEARRIVMGVRDRVMSGDRPAVPCEYCHWCALRETCHERTALAQRALEQAGGVSVVAEDFQALKRNPVALAAFLNACDSLKSLEESARSVARWRLEDDQAVPGWALTRVRGIRHVTSASAIRHTTKTPVELTVPAVLEAIGDLTLHQFERIMAVAQKPMPKNATKEGRANTYLTKAKPKNPA